MELPTRFRWGVGFKAPLLSLPICAGIGHPTKGINMMRPLLCVFLALLCLGCAHYLQHGLFQYNRALTQEIERLDAAHEAGQIDDATYVQLHAQLVAAREAEINQRKAMFLGLVGSSMANTPTTPAPQPSQPRYKPSIRPVASCPRSYELHSNPCS